MKKLKILFLFLFSLFATLSYGQILKGTGLVYTNGVPTHVPRTSTESEYAVDVSTGKGDLYLWNRTSNTWKLIPEGIEVTTTNAAPSGAPAYGQTRFRVNTVPTLYFWTGVTWVPLTGNAYTAGTGIDITSNVITNLGDLSNTNEIQYIDTLRLTGSTLEASLFNDGLSLKTVDLSSLSTNLYNTSASITDQTRVVSIPGNLIFSNNSATTGERFTIGYDNGISSTNTFDLREGVGITLSSSENNIFLEGQTSFRDVVSPSALTGNVNNYTGLNGANVGILSSNGAYRITGIDNGVHGRILFIFNNGSFDLTFENQSVSSSVENRFYMGSDYILKADTGSAIIMYDTLIPGWRAFKFQGGSGSGADAQDLGYTAATGDLTITGGTGVTIPVMTSSTRGLTPDGDGSGTDEFLREDGTWAVPPSTATDLTIGGSGPTYTIESSTGTDVTISGVGITLSESPANTLILTAVDASTTNEIQQIDTFSISGTTLSASLSSDGVPAKTVNLSGAIYTSGSDSTFVRTNGSYFGKRITSNIARGGTTTFQGLGGILTDTSGVININQGASATKYGLNFGGDQRYLIRIKADSRSDDNSDFLISHFFIDSVSGAGDNEVISMGWNTDVGGGRVDGTKASLSIRMEKKFAYGATDTIYELHLGEVHFRNGLGDRRTISAAIGHNANDGADLSFDTDYWTIHDFKTDDTKAQWVFGQVPGKSKGITFRDTASLFFEKPLSGASFYFRDSLNSLFINALTVNSSNEVYIGSTNTTTTKFGTTYLKVPTNGTVYTSDHSNFRVGDSSHKTGLIIYANDNAALTVKGPNNATGVIFRPEATEFNIQVSGGASPFYLHNNAPQIGFYMNASGNIGYLTTNPQARQHIFTSGGNTTKMLRIENSTGSNDYYRSSSSPNASITGNPGDVALTSISSFGEYWVKRTGTATNTGWESLIGAIRLTKAVPTTTDATQEIGIITHNEGGRSIFAEIDVNVAGSGFAKQKKYYIHLGFSSTSGWNTLIPITEGANSGWSGTNDFNLEMKTNTSGSPSGGIDTLRIRRVAGSTAANANITIRFFGAGVNTSFTETSATGTSTTTTLYNQGAIAQIGAKVGIRTLSPQQDFHVEGTARITGNSGSPVTFMARDADGDINAVKLGSGFSFSNDTIKYTPTSTNTFYTSNGTVTNRDVEINGPLNFTDADGDGEVNITVGGLAGANLYMTPIEHRLEYFDAASLNQVTMDDSGVELATVLGTDNIRLNSSSTVNITADSTIISTVPTSTALKSITGLNAGGTLLKIVGTNDGDVLAWDNVSNHWEVRAQSGSSGDGNGIYGGDGSIPVGGSEVSMNTIGKTVRFTMSTGNTTTGESIIITRSDNATHRYIVMRGANDSLRIFRFSNENYMQSYSATLNIAADEQLSFSADSIEMVEGTVESKTKVRFILGMTPSNFVKRIDGSVATAGQVLASDGTDWTPTTITGAVYTSSPSSNTTASGTTTTFTANENQAFGDVVRIGSDGDATIADASVIATSSGIAICTGTVTTGNTGTYLMTGFVRNDSWNWTVGGWIYLSTNGTTGNTLTQTAPSGTDEVVQILGVATHANRIWFAPQLIQIENN